MRSQKQFFCKRYKPGSPFFDMDDYKATAVLNLRTIEEAKALGLDTYMLKPSAIIRRVLEARKIK